MSSESAFLVSSQKRMTNAPSAYATHLLLCISPIDSVDFGFWTAYVVPLTLNDVLLFKAETHPSRAPGLKESVKPSGANEVKHSMSLSLNDGTWHIDGYVCPDSARKDVVSFAATSESDAGSRPLLAKVCRYGVSRVLSTGTRHQNTASVNHRDQNQARSHIRTL